MTRFSNVAIAAVLVGSIAASAAAQGDDRTFTISPTSLEVTYRIGQSPLPPKQDYTLELKGPADRFRPHVWSARLGAGVAWPERGWARIHPDGGFGSRTLSVSVMLSNLGYGINEDTLRLYGKHGSVLLDVPIRVDVQGTLVVAPLTSVYLWAIPDAKSSTTHELRLSSPGMDGLGWRVSTAEPWLKVEPKAGKTPSTVKVWGDPAGLRTFASGHLVVEADHAWEGGKVRLPVALEIVAAGSAEQQLLALRTLVGAEVAALEAHREHLWTKVLPNQRWHLPPLVSIRGRALAQLLADAELSEKHFAWAAAGVQGYLDGRPPAAIAEIGPRVCEQITEWRKRVNEILAEIRGTAEGCRQRQIQLKAQAEWTPVMDVRQGDILFVESEGAWDRHDSWERPLVEDLPQCVLCRIGDGPTFFIGRGGGFVNSATGSLQVRANISVRSESTVTCRVLSVPVPDRQRTKFLQTSGGGARLGLNYEISPGHPDLQVAWHSPLHVNPCLDAGLGFDDRVIAIDDIPVDTRWDVQELLTRLHPGMEVSVTVVKRHSGDRDEANVVLR